MSEPQFYQPECANGLENGCRPAAWAPARLARRLFEQSATDRAMPPQRLNSERTPGKLALLVHLHSQHALVKKQRDAKYCLSQTCGCLSLVFTVLSVRQDTCLGGKYSIKICKTRLDHLLLYLSNLLTLQLSRAKFRFRTRNCALILKQINPLHVHGKSQGHVHKLKIPKSPA